MERSTSPAGMALSAMALLAVAQRQARMPTSKEWLPNTGKLSQALLQRAKGYWQKINEPKNPLEACACVPQGNRKGVDKPTDEAQAGSLTIFAAHRRAIEDELFSMYCVVIEEK